jgi:hypothetical protein
LFDGVEALANMSVNRYDVVVLDRDPPGDVRLDPPRRLATRGERLLALLTTTIKTAVSRLRGKLGDPPVIETIREGGYRI